MIIDCVSDLHGEFPSTEGGDLLIIAGDCTSNDTPRAWESFFGWLDLQEYKKKVFIGGNHDNFLECSCPYEAPDGTYLFDTGTEFEGLKIWGSPWTLWFHGINPHCKAFTVSEEELAKKFALIPDDIDILVTHSPPYGMLDGTRFPNHKHVGSVSLEQVVARIKPKLHLFGHIHESHGKVQYNDTFYINACFMNEDYNAVNGVVRVEL